MSSPPGMPVGFRFFSVRKISILYETGFNGDGRIRKNAILSQNARQHFGAECSFPKHFVPRLVVTELFFPFVFFIFSVLFFIISGGIGLRLAVSTNVTDKNNHCAMESERREAVESS